MPTYPQTHMHAHTHKNSSTQVHTNPREHTLTQTCKYMTRIYINIDAYRNTYMVITIYRHSVCVYVYVRLSCVYVCLCGERNFV